MGFSVKDTIDIAAGAEKVFGVASDYAAYPEWTPEVKQVEVKESDDSGRPTLVWFEVDAKLRTIRYTLRYDYTSAPESYSWALVEGDVKALSGSYTFDELDDVTEVTYELELDPGFPVPGLFRKQGEKQLKKAALDGLKKRVEG